MIRVCFQLQVAADRLDEYRRRHAAVWPEMLAEIEAAGRRNYSLFLREDGLLIGYYETDSVERSEAYLARSEIAARWEAEMSEFFVGTARGADGSVRPDQASTALQEVFHLEDQLPGTDPTHEGTRT